MLGFDKMFDRNRDRKLDAFERSMQLYFVQEVAKIRQQSSYEDDNERDVFADAGLDYDELERMHPRERRGVLVRAGLNPDEFDF